MSTEAEVIDEPPFLTIPTSSNEMHRLNPFLENSLPTNTTNPTLASSFPQCKDIRNRISIPNTPSNVEQVSNENTPFNGSSTLRKLPQEKRERARISKILHVHDNDALDHSTVEDARTVTVQHLKEMLPGFDLEREETHQDPFFFKRTPSSSGQDELHSSKSPQSKGVRLVHFAKRPVESGNIIDGKREKNSFLTHPEAEEALGMKSPRGRHRTVRSKPFRRSQTPFNRQLVRVESDDERNICLAKHKGSGDSRVCVVVPRVEPDRTVSSSPSEDSKAGISLPQHHVTFALDAFTCETQKARTIGEHTSGGHSSDSSDGFPEEKSIRSLRSIRRGSVENFDALRRSSMMSPRGREREATVRQAKRSPTPFNRRLIKCYDGDDDDNRRTVQNPGAHETSTSVPLSYVGKKDTEMMAPPRHRVKFAEGDVAITSFSQAVPFARTCSSLCQKSSVYEHSHEECLGDTNAELSKDDTRTWRHFASSASPSHICSCDQPSKHGSRGPLNRQMPFGYTSEEEDYDALESLPLVSDSKPPHLTEKLNVTVEHLHGKAPQDPGPGPNACGSDRGSEASHEASCQSYKCCHSNDSRCKSCVFTAAPRIASGFLYKNRDSSCISRDSDVDAICRSMSRVTAASSTISVDIAPSQKEMQVRAKCEKGTQTTVDYASSSPFLCHCEHMEIVEARPTYPFVAVMNLVNRLINMFRF